MPMQLLLLLYLIGHVFAKEPPDVECRVVYLEYVECSWNKQGTPDINYTFSSWFYNDKETNCTTYVLENGIKTGCKQPYGNDNKRFLSFYTTLVHGNKSTTKGHELKNKVLLYPPVNVTVKNGSDFNLWFYWNQTKSNCAESDVRYRTNKRKWEHTKVSSGRQIFCINLPSSNSEYELQVRSRIGKDCGESIYWSNWSEPVVWGSNNSTDANLINSSMPVWTPVLFVVGIITLILLAVMLLHHERLRIYIIPVVPKPSLISHDIENWLQISKNLKENFKANYTERACPVREYCHVSQSDSESSDDFTCSVTTNQTDCSISSPVNQSEDLPTPCSSAASTVTVSSEK
uniref:Fibronectin type-III domain-containing protein n=1 Tax=Monopterus albus TaxID=43700 RepID=A0A3Q3KCW9_MONAL|nr:cytokine receptor common subunit gamma-like isoform X2 [Monopterus albus]